MLVLLQLSRVEPKIAFLAKFQEMPGGLPFEHTAAFYSPRNGGNKAHSWLAEPVPSSPTNKNYQYFHLYEVVTRWWKYNFNLSTRSYTANSFFSSVPSPFKKWTSFQSPGPNVLLVQTLRLGRGQTR